VGRFGEVSEQMIALTSQSDTFRDLMSDLFAASRDIAI